MRDMMMRTMGAISSSSDGSLCQQSHQNHQNAPIFQQSRPGRASHRSSYEEVQSVSVLKTFWPLTVWDNSSTHLDLQCMIPTMVSRKLSQYRGNHQSDNDHRVTMITHTPTIDIYLEHSTLVIIVHH